MRHRPYSSLDAGAAGIPAFEYTDVQSCHDKSCSWVARVVVMVGGGVSWWLRLRSCAREVANCGSAPNAGTHAASTVAEYISATNIAVDAAHSCRPQ